MHRDRLAGRHGRGEVGVVPEPRRFTGVQQVDAYPAARTDVADQSVPPLARCGRGDPPLQRMQRVAGAAGLASLAIGTDARHDVGYSGGEIRHPELLTDVW